MQIVILKNDVVSEVIECLDVIEVSTSEHPTIKYESVEDGKCTLGGLKLPFFVVEGYDQQGNTWLEENDLKDNYIKLSADDEIKELKAELSRKDAQIKNLQQVTNTILFEEGV